jgi:hypothetical protein
MILQGKLIPTAIEETKTMTTLEFDAIEILKSGEPLPVDIYIYLNESGIDPEFLINLFKKEEQLEPN